MAKCQHVAYATSISARKAAEAAKPVKLAVVRCPVCRKYRLEA